MAETFYAWSDIHAGGETEERTRANKMVYTVVTSRNVIRRGEKVTKAGLKVSDAEWDALVEGGSIRPYPIPDGADEYTSPATAFTRSVVDDRGEIDVNKLIDLGLIHTPTNPPATEGAEVPVGT